MKVPFGLPWTFPIRLQTSIDAMPFGHGPQSHVPDVAARATSTHHITPQRHALGVVPLGLVVVLPDHEVVIPRAVDVRRVVDALAVVRLVPAAIVRFDSSSSSLVCRRVAIGSSSSGGVRGVGGRNGGPPHSASSLPASSRRRRRRRARRARARAKNKHAPVVDVVLADLRVVRRGRERVEEEQQREQVERCLARDEPPVELERARRERTNERVRVVVRVRGGP